MNINTVVKIRKLLSTETATKSNVTEEKTNAQSYKRLKMHLPLITCNCGAEILFVPDISETEIGLMREDTCAFFRRASDN